MILEKYFPFKTPRSLQIEAMRLIDSAYSSGKRFVILEAPTGFGKSPTVLAVAKKYGPAHILTPQKILQAQYLRDFPNDMFVMKGKGNFVCDVYDIRCGDKTCKVPKMFCGGSEVFSNEIERVDDETLRRCFGKESKQPNMSLIDDIFTFNGKEYIIDACTYRVNMIASKISDVTVHNFHSFINQACFNPFTMHDVRDILIIDEAHNIENICMDSFHLDLSNKLFNYEKFPIFSNLGDIVKYFTEDNYSDKIENLISSLKIKYEYVNNSRLTYLSIFKAYYELKGESKLMKEYDRLISKIARFVRYYKEGKEFVFEYSDKNNEQKISVKPVYIKFWMDNLFDFGKKVFLTSATILNKDIFCDNLGIKKNNCEFIQMPSEFPIKNRKIYALPIGNMTMHKIEEDMPKLIDMSRKIINSNAYCNKKGIIHTHTNKITEAIKKSIKSKRLLFADDFHSREEMLDFHYKSNNTILVAPAMHEGLDLKDDHGRFQIIMKVPYPSMGDIQIKERVKVRKEWDWYSWLAALKLVQSYGRCVRHKDDYADTYILDKKFIDFVYSSGSNRFLPSWFTGAVDIRR